MFCEKCGKMNDDNSKFCVGCGNPMNAAVNASVSEAAPMPGDSFFSAPTDMDMSAQVYESQPAPVYETQSEPVYEAQPAPVYVAQPEPVYESQPAPVYETQPEPVYEAQSAPVYEQQNVPMYGNVNAEIMSEEYKEPVAFGLTNAEPLNEKTMPFASQFSSLLKNKKMLTIIGSVLAIIVALIIILSVAFCGGSSGAESPEAVVETFIEAMEDGDYDECLSLLPEVISEEVKKSDTYDMKEKGYEQRCSMIDDISYRIVSKDKYTDDSLEMLNKTISQTVSPEGENTVLKATEAYKINVEVIFEVYGMTQPSDERLTVFKDAETGKWYLWMPELF